MSPQELGRGRSGPTGAGRGRFGVSCAPSEDLMGWVVNGDRDSGRGGAVETGEMSAKRDLKNGRGWLS